MKNLYNTIEQNLKVGLQVVVKDLTDNTYCTISNSKDSYGDYKKSYWCNSIEEAKQTVGTFYGYSKECWDNLDLEIVEVYRPEYKPFKVGDKVRILDSIKKIDNWELLKEKLQDVTGEIRGVCLNASGTSYLVNNSWIGHEYLAPLQEIKEEIEELTMEQLCKELGREVKIKK